MAMRLDHSNSSANKSLGPQISAKFDPIDMKSLWVIAKSNVPLLPLNGQLGIVLSPVDSDDFHLFHTFDFIRVHN